MKKLILCLVVLTLMLSFGIASALDGSKIPQQFQDAYTAEFGTKANFVIWFPVVPELSQLSWSNILILSNFNNFAVNVGCWVTSYANEQTLKTYTLPFFGKRIIQLNQSGFADSLYDIYCSSDQIFGAAVLLLEGGKISTAWPPVFFF
jgi:hypothetical protein